jgi:hypothetical protein
MSYCTVRLYLDIIKIYYYVKAGLIKCLYSVHIYTFDQYCSCNFNLGISHLYVFFELFNRNTLSYVYL